MQISEPGQRRAGEAASAVVARAGGGSADQAMLPNPTESERVKRLLGPGWDRIIAKNHVFIEKQSLSVLPSA